MYIIKVSVKYRNQYVLSKSYRYQLTTATQIETDAIS